MRVKTRIKTSISCNPKKEVSESTFRGGFSLIGNRFLQMRSRQAHASPGMPRASNHFHPVPHLDTKDIRTTLPPKHLRIPKATARLFSPDFRPAKSFRWEDCGVAVGFDSATASALGKSPPAYRAT